MFWYLQTKYMNYGINISKFRKETSLTSPLHVATRLKGGNRILLRYSAFPICFFCNLTSLLEIQKGSQKEFQTVFRLGNISKTAIKGLRFQ